MDSEQTDGADEIPGGVVTIGQVRRGTSSLDRMLSVLDLFDGADPEWTVEAMHERLGFTRSTLYRYLKALTDAGLLTSWPGIGYTLGPRIAELDYQVRQRDPLITASRGLMLDLARDAEGIALLCRRYRRKVLCVHQERGTDAIRSGYERGKARPLLRGAASQIILAYLPARTVQRLHAEHGAAMAAIGLGADLAAVGRTLRSMRRAGLCVTRGQVTKGVIGIAAPLLEPGGTILGSLSVTLPERGQSEAALDAVAARVVLCAESVNATLAGPGAIAT